MGACRARGARAVAAGAAAALVLFAPAPASAAGLSPRTVAKRLPEQVVVVERAMRRELDTAAIGRLRLRIVDRRIGRIKVAVVADRALRSRGGIAAYAKAIDRAGPTRGTLIVAGPTSMQLITSYPQDGQAVAAVKDALERLRAPLEIRLRTAIDAVAAVDPGPSGDLQRGARQPAPVAATPGTVVVPEDIGAGVDDVLDTVRLVMLGVGGLIALLVLVRVGLAVAPAWRRRREAALDVADARESARERLLAVGDGIRELDVAEGMPGASEAGRRAYARALDRYERADRLLSGEPGPRAIRRAVVALAEGEQALTEARAAFRTPLAV